ncbi:MAG TPA: sigma-70 family RNA polymerase sigma factor [Thermoleophilia bacterium]|nr:sigma-70 family RNA polymerase sigma factor [Thermoleophilia bacterium]
MREIDDDAIPSDVALWVKEAAAGNQVAWTRLIDRFSPMVAAITRTYRLNTADTEDVCQTVWLRLVEGIGTIRDPERVAAWLAAVTRNEAFRLIRRAGREAPVADTGLDETPLQGSEPDARILAGEARTAVQAALDRLPARSQEVMRLLLADPAPGYGDVAAHLAIPVNSVGPTRHRALRALAHSPALAAVGFTPPA